MIFNGFDLVPVLPEIFIAICAMGLLIVGVNGGVRSTPVVCLASLVVVVIGFIILMVVGSHEGPLMNDALKNDAFIAFVRGLILVGLGFVLALSFGSMKAEGLERFEFPVLVLFAGLGMMVMVLSNHFLTFYMGLELQSLSLYVLAAMRRGSLNASEAGVKYFILGALSSGFILFGTSLIYGFTGSLDFAVVGDQLGGWDVIPLGATFGLVFVLAGAAFKVSAAPFHMWTPDVYQGAPTLVIAFFAIVPKVAAVAILVRLLYEPFMGAADQWEQIVYVLSVLSMVVGAFAALVQTNLKRLLAFSSIGNMGYVLMGVLSVTSEGMAAVLLYLLIYMVMSAGTFALVLCLRRDGIGVYALSDLSGLSKTVPKAAYGLAILMFSMSGIPPMAGFFGKLFIFQAAMDQGYVVLAVIGVVSSVVAAYYYLKVIKIMFFEDQEAALGFDENRPVSLKIVSILSIAFVLLFVAKPSFYIDLCLQAAQGLGLAP